MNHKLNRNVGSGNQTSPKIEALYASFDFEKKETIDSILKPPLIECIEGIPMEQMEVAAVEGGVIYLANCLDNPSKYHFNFTLSDDFKIPFVEIGNYRNLDMSVDEFRQRLLFLSEDLIQELQEDLELGKFIAAMYPGLTFRELGR